MVLSKALGKNPRVLADEIAALLRADADIADVSVAGPGFINIRLSARYWQALLSAMVTAGETYGASTIGTGRKVNVEYVSANPTVRCMSAIAAAR